jgi:[acyl-carrier-protein] S-malonyltransferase
MDVDQLRDGLATTAIALRGYNVHNLGRSQELLEHDTYGPRMADWLGQGSEIAADLLKRPVDLVSQVKSGTDTTLESYGEAIAMIVSVELAQLEILREDFDVDYTGCQLAFGYSLGEITALVAAGTISFADALAVPLLVSEDCVVLSEGVTLGVLFSREETIDRQEVDLALIIVNQQDDGVVGISAELSPNTLLLMGQSDTLERLRDILCEDKPRHVVLRKNKESWPPLHSPIMWQRNVPNRSAQAMLTISSGNAAPSFPVLSLVTGGMDYTESNCREMLHRWIDHPQLLWDVVYETLKLGVETVVHIGPGPNIIPSTYQRLATDVKAYVESTIGMRLLSAVVQRPWMQMVMPDRTALLRAPSIEHVILEDWLLEASA